MSGEIFGGIELGGTKIRVATGSADGAIGRSDTFPTGSPEESFARVLGFFRDGPPLAAIGAGAFGPVAINPGDPDYGRVRDTPKPGWRGFDIAGALAELGAPVAIDTDVNAAGRGEAALGALAGCASGVYLTVGTGIGGGLMLGGRPAAGAGHPEMGHVPLVRAPADDFPSVCPFHPHCAEGLASGPAIQRRFGASLSELAADHPGRELIAFYLGQLAATLVLVAAPERIVIGGGVAKTPGLHTRIHRQMLAALNGYALYPAVRETGAIVPPALGDDSGLAGALLLAASIKPAG
jgi:fructokinase